MLQPKLHNLFLCLLLIVLINCNCSIIIKTKSGLVSGIWQKTYKSNKLYTSFKGIPYAEPPVGDLRYKVPVPVKPWNEILVTSDKYKDACPVLVQSMLFPLNSTQSENCLFLNVFVPAYNLLNKLLPVMFFIHAGAFTEGDGHSGFYGPDTFMEDEGVILVTVDYRLGPLGFMNFELPGLTGNMGFKDQQLALKWVSENIKYFGGDPDAITVFGYSSGGYSTHFHVLNEYSRKLFARAILMSGNAVAYSAHYEPNNQLELVYDAFKDELNGARDPRILYDFMKTASLDVLMQKTPANTLFTNVLELYWGAVIENKTLAVDPFLIERPRAISQTTHIDTEMLFGVTSAEALSLLVPSNLYVWVDSLTNSSSIRLPFRGLTLPKNSLLYKEMQQVIYEFYFGKEKIQKNVYYLNQYVQMLSDANFVYSFYDSMELHKSTKTVCYYSYAYQELYENIEKNPNDHRNIQTKAAMRFVPKYFIDFAKSGQTISSELNHNNSVTCTELTNDGLKSINNPRKDAMDMLNDVYDRVKPWIVNQF
ncbi:venom carboxylesterase-6-like isoform X2 [Contarinia nasturtii]|uniref:venom carboxylesterase-6-like isoform X2 n=1 Tax=Contarinia nasturtii TaxID=265458 RepID=UPI0012D445D6|nr:venom carboxylesterase-6-like isoform X2 [Contarinia nasturtii]